MNPTGVIDIDHLRGYTGGDPEVERDVFSAFREQCDMWGRALDPKGDEETWRSATHALKGLARGMGAFTLAEACERAEDLAGDAGSAVARSIALEDLRSAMNDAIHAVAVLEQKAGANFRKAAGEG
ncbi:MAG: Hpt domain-containing protein [Maricaulaceae bacterium]|jgi:HPt (histidine-containing phosphotransfer) domain-containing protein